MHHERFPVEESAALLHATFPNYPELHEINPAPQVELFCDSAHMNVRLFTVS
jgi:hypothetical protein